MSPRRPATGVTTEADRSVALSSLGALSSLVCGGSLHLHRRVTRESHHYSAVMDDATLMTAADLEALQAELAQLEGEGRRDIASRIKTAREWGDLKENSEYHDAKNEQAHLETRIAMLRDRLARAQVVEVAEDGGPNGVVAFGSVVIVRDEQGREQRFELVS